MTTERRLPRPPRPRLVPAAAVALALVLLVSTLVVAFVAANTNDGASTPEGAVHALFAAIADRDVIGVVEALPPGERHAIGESLPSLAEQLRRLGFVADVSLEDVGGAVSADGLTLSTREFSGEVVRVDVTGGVLRASWPPGNEPITALGRSLLDELGLNLAAPGEELLVDFADEPLHLMTVKEAGGWHVSLFFTIAESLRREADAPEPWWGRGPAAIGADTADAAVRDLFKAASEPDPGRAQSIAYPDEMRAFYDYAPLFLPESRRAALEAYEDERFFFGFSELVLEMDGTGHQRTIRVTRFDGSFGDDVEQVRVRYDGSCASFEFRRSGDEVHVERRCDGDLAPASDLARDSAWYPLFAWTQLGRVFPTFIVQERNGRWFVSPTRSVLATLTEVLRELPVDQAPAFVQRVGDVWHAYSEEPASASP